MVSNAQIKRGPKPGDWVDLKTQITPELNRGLDELVRALGISKASLVRKAVANLLAENGAIPPEHPDQIRPTPTRGPGLASQKETHD